uniref:Uncharacterized protein n=1 Tax=viral metagenome TaxID=1070528 RepID=A0A6M3M9W2_9ZZZZ
MMNDRDKLKAEREAKERICPIILAANIIAFDGVDMENIKEQSKCLKDDCALWVAYVNGCGMGAR